MLLLTAPTVSFHFDSFIAGIDAFFHLWQPANERGKLTRALRGLERVIFWRLFFPGYHSGGVHVVFVALSHFPRFSKRKRGLQNCFARYFFFFHLSPVKCFE